MAEISRFFDSVTEVIDGIVYYDRDYNAQGFTDYFRTLVTTGVMKGAGKQLNVTANGSNMITNVDTGTAFIEGRHYENTEPLLLTHDTETIGLSRIDRIVIRMDLSPEARIVRAFIKKGVPSANPVPPALTQTFNLYEISVAQVKIVGGQTFIATDAITDERGTDIICPWAGSKILPNFDNEALQELVENQVNDGKYSKKFSGDLNNLTTTGFYSCDPIDTTNLPIPDSLAGRPWLMIVNQDKVTGATLQMGVQAINGDGYNFFFRVKTIADSWMDWKIPQGGGGDLSEYAKKKQEPDFSIPLATGWVPNIDKLWCYKDNFGIVHLYGVIFGSIKTNGTLLFTLPTGYRPIRDMFFGQITMNTPENRGSTEIKINRSTGDCTLGANTNDVIYVDFSFRTN
ncbi:pyocin knob domain-containing protein [Bacillus sp. JJ722]|uniref:pyocin knob domain-containing protein n=1 Tax=Bacillus sp. JJ722 TaxID=3122973 RepID=UPI0030000585